MCLEYSLTQKCILEMQSFSIFHYEQLSRSASPPNTCSQGHHTGNNASPCVCSGSTMLPREVNGVFLVLPVEMGFPQTHMCSSETRQLWDTSQCDQNQHPKLSQTPQSGSTRQALLSRVKRLYIRDELLEQEEITEGDFSPTHCLSFSSLNQSVSQYY